MRASTRTLAIGGCLLLVAALAAGCAANSADPVPQAVSCENSALDGLTMSSRGDGVSVTGIIDNGAGNTQPFQVGISTRVILAVTGDGTTQFTLTDPDGQSSELAWGPIQRVRGSLGAAGTEYSIGLRFAAEGCWTLTAGNGSGSATLTLPVQATDVAATAG